MEGRYGLSAAALKYLAALFMLVDHIGVVFPTILSDMGLPAWTDLLPRLIGRLAFPIFAYFVAEGCRRTRFFSRYLIRLGLFALISQVPFTLATGTWGGNVILTEGLVLQDEKLWKGFLQREILPENHACELYFEEPNIEAFAEKLEKLYPSIRYANRLMRHSWGQKVIRFYDLDGNLIEVGTPEGSYFL